ncbi:hypothetical protein [Limnobacter sp. P1]|uniref:hypothetical protein n=1 Tax=Limnobacter olei TaxID=3031298 RepID=UPI0023B19189|nr:hypothetical protein [Limnobacter sp. P1]
MGFFHKLSAITAMLFVMQGSLANAQTAIANPRVSVEIGATTTASAVTQPAIITIVKSSTAPGNSSRNNGNGRGLAINYTSTIVGGCQGATSEGCFSIRTNTTPIVSVPLTFVNNRLSMLKGSKIHYLDDQVNSVSVSLFQDSTQIGKSVSLSPGGAGVITFNMDDVDQLLTREFRIVYQLDLKTQPEDGTYTGTWPIILGTISLINP